MAPTWLSQKSRTQLSFPSSVHSKHPIEDISVIHSLFSIPTPVFQVNPLFLIWAMITAFWTFLRSTPNCVPFETYSRVRTTLHITLKRIFLKCKFNHIFHLLKNINSFLYDSHSLSWHQDLPKLGPCLPFYPFIWPNWISSNVVSCFVSSDTTFMDAAFFLRKAPSAPTHLHPLHHSSY